ncbi:MAG: transglycosylase SLT domain-containing protein [Idiomarina sp.]|nr:transglycosylase SLT domain-containing protein [Idiomarina sp.]
MRNEIKQAFKKSQRNYSSRPWSAFTTAIFITALLLTLGHTPSIQAGTKTEQAAQRALFERVERQINNRRFEQARSGMAELRNYPLYPYLELAYLRQNLSIANEGLIAEFLDEFEGTPLDSQLRTPWLRFLAQRNDAERFLLYYQGSANNELQCRYLNFMWQTTDNLSAFWPQVTNQWLSGRSQPNQCDSVFEAWAAAGYRTEEVIWERLKLAVDARQAALVRYLTRLLPESSRYLAEHYRRLHANPAHVMRFDEFTNQDPREQEMVLEALQRFVWRDIDSAILAWEHYQSVFEFSADVKADVHERLGITKALRGEPTAIAWLEQVPVHQLSDTGQQWLLAALLRQRRFDRIVMVTNSLPSDERNKAQWRYWRARALGELSFHEESEALMREVAEQRNYYGFLAAAHLDIAPSLEHQPVVYEPSAMAGLKEQPAVRRALELFALDRILDARREWNVVMRDSTYDEQVLAAVLAYEHEWFDQAIFSLARTGQFNDVERRFPLAFRELFETYAAENGLDPAWVYAIARRESAFRQDAVSSAGARGLMQVMPQTAEYINRRMPLPNPNRMTLSRLMRPDENVRLGTFYMADLMRRTDQHWIIATAAYNAGMNRVVEWLPEEEMEFDIWVEAIPFQETRDYVKNVLAYQQIYTILLGKDANVLMPLVTMKMRNNGRS